MEALSDLTDSAYAARVKEDHRKLQLKQFPDSFYDLVQLGGRHTPQVCGAKFVNDELASSFDLIEILLEDRATVLWIEAASKIVGRVLAQIIVLLAQERNEVYRRFSWQAS